MGIWVMMFLLADAVSKAFEQFGNIEHLVACISERDDLSGLPLCNPHGCPTMSAGR